MAAIAVPVLADRGGEARVAGVRARRSGTGHPLPWLTAGRLDGGCSYPWKDDHRDERERDSRANPVDVGDGLIQGAMIQLETVQVAPAEAPSPRPQGGAVPIHNPLRIAAPCALSCTAGGWVLVNAPPCATQGAGASVWGMEGLLEPWSLAGEVGPEVLLDEEFGPAGAPDIARWLEAAAVLVEFRS